MNNKCRDLGLILLFFGILFSCITAFQVASTGNSSWLLTVMVLIVGSFLSYVVYVCLNALAEILENQEKLFKSIDNLSMNKNADNDIVPAGYWKCNCGKINPNYTGTCGCGNNKPK